MTLLRPCPAGAGLESEVEQLQGRVVATKSGYEAAATKLAEKRACLVECEREHAALAAERNELQGKLGEAGAERKRVAHR
jgi:chromosome segregation ATPase